VSGGFRRGRLRGVLVVTELALSLVAADRRGLMMRTFMDAECGPWVSIRESSDRAAAVFPHGQYQKAEDKRRFFSQFTDEGGGAGGSGGASEINGLPPFGSYSGEIEIPGRTHTEKMAVDVPTGERRISEDAGLKRLRGRFLEETDIAGPRRVAVVNQHCRRSTSETKTRSADRSS